MAEVLTIHVSVCTGRDFFVLVCLCPHPPPAPRVHGLESIQEKFPFRMYRDWHLEFGTMNLLCYGKDLLCTDNQLALCIER